MAEFVSFIFAEACYLMLL